MEEVVDLVRPFPQQLVAVPADRAALEGADRIWQEVRAAEAKLGEDGRVVLRASGTEAVVRVMVEAADAAECERLCDHLVDVVTAEIGGDSAMCGIVGYVGSRPCKELLLQGLERLEYRGYDSAGICLMNGQVDIVRRVGKVSVLRDAVGPDSHPATMGLAHTRWATHGGVIEANAHPIEACEGSGVTVVHNGIIENYATLRARALRRRPRVPLRHRLRGDRASRRGLLLRRSGRGRARGIRPPRRATSRSPSPTATSPEILVAARRGCPLVVGVGEGEMFMASAIPAFLR